MRERHYFAVKSSKLSGHNYGLVKRRAFEILRSIAAQTKRKPYIKSKYFRNRKVFLSVFMSHFFDKPPQQRLERMKFIGCGLEVIRRSHYPPTRKVTQKEMLYRFYGKTAKGEKFIVQLKENKSGRLYLVSIFPE